MRSIALAFAAIVSTVACASNDSGSDEPALIAIPAPSGNWSCVGGAKLAAAEVPLPSLVVHARHVTTLLPLAGLEARACNEPPCIAPLGETTTDENGVARLFGAPATFVMLGGSSFPWNVFYTQPTATSLDAAVYDAGAVAVANDLAYAKPFGQRGIVVVRVLDCAGVAAPNVAFAIPGGDKYTVARYVEGGQPLATGTRATDASGRGVVFDVPAGIFRIEAREVAGARIVAAREAYLPADGVTHLELQP